MGLHIYASVLPVPPKKSKSINRLLKIKKIFQISFFTKFKNYLIFSYRWLKSKLTRGMFANLFMFCFIMLTSIGAGMIFLPAGLVVAGVTFGVFGFILGLE